MLCSELSHIGSPNLTPGNAYPIFHQKESCYSSVQILGKNVKHDQHVCEDNAIGNFVAIE